MVFTCNNIEKAFGITVVLKQISFILEEGEKAAIVGVNGAGKTTLLKIITGEMDKDGGDITLKKGARIGYLSQMTDMDETQTLEQALLSVFEGIVKMEMELRELEKAMSTTEGEPLMEMMNRYSKLSGDFESANGYEYESRVRGMIKGLGFSAEESQRTVSTFSGGQKTRIALGRLLLTAPEILLLDEPTNHLDIESVEWLEDVFLKSYSGSVLVVSHDRYFLDKTVTKVIEIENGKSDTYNGNYTYYALKKESDRVIAMKHFIDQQKEIKRQEDIIKQLRSFNREKSIKRAESREKMLSKIERVEKPEDLPDKIRIRLEPRKMSGNDVLSVKFLRKVFDDGVLFENISFEIKRGEITALIGPNGIGKTTLIRMIMEAAKDDRSIRLGTNVEIGYFDQEYRLLHDDKTIFGEISDSFPYLKNVEIRNTLAAFVFTGDDVFKLIHTLSGGEKGRVALAKLMLSNANFLLLDEPTNHLDMFSKEILEEALRNYTGTILYISHDRYFINNTADQILEMKKDGTTLYLGNYDYYVETKANRASDSLQESIVNTQVSNKDDWKKKKDSASEERKKQTRIDKIEKEAAAIEQNIKELDNLLALEEVYTSTERAMAIVAEKAILDEKLAHLLDEWAELE